MRRTNRKKRESRRRPDLDLAIKGFRFAFGLRTYVMGVLNVTPDSFSDGGKYCDLQKAVRHAAEMANEGADIIDVGGESTRPGACDIGEDEEMRRVVEVVKTISKKVGLPVSIDTRKAPVAEAAIKAGACIINDVSGMKHDPRMAKVAARHGAAVILMHMKGSPRDMQADPQYHDVIADIIKSLKESVGLARRAGVKEEKIIVDPGIGFGKTLEHNLEILNRLGELKKLGRPICIGTSRKSFIGKVLNIEDPRDRLTGTIASSAIAVMNGANILRVHDVSQARSAARMADSILRIRMR